VIFGGLNGYWFLSILFGVVCLVLTLWFALRNKIKSDKIFDISLIIITLSFIVPRILGLIFDTVYYLKDIQKVFSFSSREFSIEYLVFAFVVVIYIISKRLLKFDEDYQQVLERILIISIICLIPIILGALVSGKIIGIQVQSDLGLMYENGIKRMPIGIFWIIYFIGFMVIYSFIKKGKTPRINNLYSVFFICTSAFGFVLNFFIGDYKANFLNIISDKQFLDIVIFLMGLFIFFYWSKPNKSIIQKGIGQRRSLQDLNEKRMEIRTSSHNFRTNDYLDKQDRLPNKEKAQSIINSLKRKLRK